MVEFFSGLIANRLANELLKFAAPRLRDRVLGSDEERALGRAFQRAFSAMLEEVAEPTSPELAGELESQLDRFVTDQEVANALLDIAIERRKPPVGRLRARFEELGFDPETFLTDFDRAINSFAFQLTDELRKEAAKNQSALFNQVTMAEFDSLREQLQEVLERLDRTGDDKHLTTFANTAPPMPPNFVPRPEELNELRQAVIGDGNTGPVALTGLRGMGGIGKTALAIALCHDDGLQEIFADGVVWVDIGREPGNLAGKMRRVGQALGDGPGYYDTPEAGIDRLRLLLKDKAVLLVLDDVWDARHVEPFIVEAPRCRVLFTTRNADIALGLDAREIPLDVLAPEQAISLLREWTGRGEPVFPEIADRLGYLPLALKLAGARLRGGMSGAEWLETFQRVSQIKLSRRSTDPQENLLVSFELSVRELPAEDRRLYYALGIFPEDIRTPQSVVGRLWRQLSPELSRFDCDELVTELGQLALIERNADDKTVILHDLLREYAREQLGDELAATHAALLSAYNPDGKPWPQIEHDGYLYHHLAYHLREAGRKEELYELLTGSPDWMEAKFIACTGDTAYVADLDLVMRDFDDPVAAPDKVLMLVKLHAARQVVNARVSSYPDTDLRTLVWLGREDEALAHARLRSKTKGKVDSLLAVYGALKEKGRPTLSLLHEAREVANNIEGDRERAEALSTVAAALAQSGGDRRARELFDEAREVACSIEDDYRRSEALSRLSGALIQAGRYDEAREIARSIKRVDPRAETLISLMRALVQARRYDEAREVASSIEDDLERSYVLSSLVAALAQAGRYEEAREIAHSIEDDGSRLEALRDLAGALAQAGCYEGAREAASTIEDDSKRAEALRDLAGALAQAGRYEEAREVARSIEQGWYRAKALSFLAAALAQSGDDCRARELFDEARGVAHSIKSSWGWSEALRDLAGALAQAGCYKAQEVARGIEDDSWRAQTLSSLAKALARAERYEEAREVARGIEHGWYRAEALRDLAAALAQSGDDNRARELFDEAREVACSIEDDGSRSEALSHLAAVLAQAGRYDEAREVAHSIEDDYFRSALRFLAEAFTQAGCYAEAREVARNIKNDSNRWGVLRDLVAALAQVGRFNYALAVLGLCELNKFLQALAVCTASFEQVKPGLSVDALREVTGIAGWVRSDWREIHELLNF